MAKLPRAKCVNFDDLKKGTKYKVKDVFASCGFKVRVLPHQWSGNPPT